MSSNITVGARRHYFFDTSGISHPDPAQFAVDSLEPNGVFTTFRSYPSLTSSAGGRLFLLNEHLDRVTANARSLKLVDGTDEIHQPRYIESALLNLLRDEASSRVHGIGSLRIRILIRSSSSFEIVTEPFAAPISTERSLRVRSIESIRVLPEIKSTCLTACRAAEHQALRLGADHALLLGEGKVREGAWANFFYFDALGQLCTPGQDMLPGIIRTLILAHHDCRLVRIGIDELLDEARAAFFCNSTRGIMPIHQIDSLELSRAGIAALTHWFDAFLATSAIELLP